MSIKIAKIKNYLKETYQKLGEIHYAYYWNLGYISCLNDEGKIDKPEFAGLAGYNDKLYFIEDMKIRNRKVAIKKEELKEMELERIKKRIDEELIFINNDNSFCDIDNCHEMQRIAHNALETYRELIIKTEEIGNPIYNWEVIIQELEEKYYPRPKPKTTKEKINKIINKYSMSINKDINYVIEDLIGIRDSIED